MNLYYTIGIKVNCCVTKQCLIWLDANLKSSFTNPSTYVLIAQNIGMVSRILNLMEELSYTL